MGNFETMKPYSYYSLHPSSLYLDGGAMFGIIPKPLWNKKIPSDELNRIPMTMRVWLIKSKDKLIVIDSGAGDYQGEKFNERYGLLNPPKSFQSLLKESMGAEPGDVTDFVLTHLHFDHACGALTGLDLKPSFPNATLHLHRAHYEYSLKPSLRDGGSFQQPIIKKTLESYQNIHWLNEMDNHITESLYFQTCHGHTPFQILPYNKDFIFLADVIPTHAHLSIPWVMGYDLQPSITCNEKQLLLDWISQKNLNIIFDHDANNIGGKVLKNQQSSQFELVNVFKSQQTYFEEVKI